MLENANYAEEIVIDFGDGDQVTIDPGSLPAGADQIDVEHEYADAGPHEIVVTILRDDNCGEDGSTLTQAGNVQVPPWLCPSNVTIGVTDGNGVPVVFGAGICQPAGNYTATAFGTDLDGADLSWTLDGVFLGNGSSVGFTFNPAGGLINGECCSVPTSSVSVAAGSGGDPEVCSNQDECPPSTATATLTACRRDYLEKGWCSLLLKLGILVMVGIFAIMLAIMLCPAIVALPSLPITLPPWLIAIWEFVAFWVVVLAPYIALAAAFIGVMLYGPWSFLCRPDRCFDITVIVWQALFVMGVIFFYFGMCPACIALWFIGIPLLLASAAVFIGWLIFCNPTPCKVFYEIGVLSIAQVIVGWLAIFLGACIWTYGTWFMAGLQTLLFVVGFLGTVFACLVQPPRG